MEIKIAIGKKEMTAFPNKPLVDMFLKEKKKEFFFAIVISMYNDVIHVVDLSCVFAGNTNVLVGENRFFNCPLFI